MTKKNKNAGVENAAASASKGGGEAVRTPADHRKARAAAKLKENLLRRKQQQRARRAGEADEGEGLPAANSTNPDD